MHTKFCQVSIAEIYKDCVSYFEEEKPKFLALLEEHLNISDFIPQSFYNAFYKHYGRNRDYPLEGYILSLMLQKIFGIASVSILIYFLRFSKELREFCGFKKVPDASKFTRFKQDFSVQLEVLFNYLVDVTEPICQKIDAELASDLIFDTSGVESYVTENNPKYINKIIRQLKAQYKNNPDVDPYKLAYRLMPTSAAANKDIKQLYINGHFCYVYKFGILTNGLGIVRHISFLDKDFKAEHPEMNIDTKTDSPDEDKSIGDSTALKPVLNDYFALHPDFKRGTFIGDSAFDNIGAYPFLLNDCKFNRAVIPMNMRNTSFLPPAGFDENGHPLCPNDSTLPMKPDGWSIEKGRNARFKWGCPKSKNINGKRVTFCENPCTSSTCGRMVYTYPHQDLRLCPNIIRNSDEWNKIYKIRPIVEQTINQFKEHMGVGKRQSQDRKTTKADLLLAGITQLFTVILADKINQHQFIRSVKPLIS